MREVQGAVIGIVLVLAAVFIPVAFLGGIAGQLYRQFAVTVTVAVVLSGVVALTLTPALCALLLKPGAWRAEPPVQALQPCAFGWVTRALLRRACAWPAPPRRWRCCLFAGVLRAWAGCCAKVPGSFVPPEDQGYIIAAAQLPDGATLERTEATTDRACG
jgi:multidrug efflux pump subunit AcrB